MSFLFGYMINLIKRKELNFSKELKDKLENSVYSSYIKKLNKNLLNKKQKIIYFLLKRKVYFLVFIIIKMKF